MVDTADTLYIQARAQILWGSSRKEVKRWLYDQGCYGSEADKILDICLMERARRVRHRAWLQFWGGLFGIILLALLSLLEHYCPVEEEPDNFFLIFTTFFYPALAYYITAAIIKLVKGANAKGTISSIEDAPEPYEKKRWRL